MDVNNLINMKKTMSSTQNSTKTNKHTTCKTCKITNSSFDVNMIVSIMTQLQFHSNTVSSLHNLGSSEWKGFKKEFYFLCVAFGVMVLLNLTFTFTFIQLVGDMFSLSGVVVAGSVLLTGYPYSIPGGEGRLA